MAMTSVEEFVSTPDGMRLYQQDRSIESVTGLICTLMENQGVSRTELARRLGMTPGRVTQLLDGESNKTVRTLSDMFVALGHSLNFVAGSLDIHQVGSWIDTAPANPILEVSSAAFLKTSSLIVFSTGDKPSITYPRKIPRPVDTHPAGGRLSVRSPAPIETLTVPS